MQGLFSWKSYVTFPSGKNIYLRKTYATKYLFREQLLFGVYRPTREFFTDGVVIITGEGLQVLIYARQSWPLSSEGSLACHTYCVTGHPFIMVSGVVTICFYDLSLSLGFEYTTFRLRGERSNPLRHRRGLQRVEQRI